MQTSGTPQDSFGAGCVLRRTLEWSLLLNQVPDVFGGGPFALQEQTITEWNTLRARIQAGQPCPIGLIYTNRPIWDQHQVLVYGYEAAAIPSTGGALYIYDPNAPHAYGDTGNDFITFRTTADGLSAVTPGDGPDKLAGFFCADYTPAAPPAGLAQHYGRFISWADDPRAWLATVGCKFPLQDFQQLQDLGGSPTDVRATGSPLPRVSVRPRDGALLRELHAPAPFLYQGGAPFTVPDNAWLDRFGGEAAVSLVPDGTLGAFAGPPDEGTLLREWSDEKVYLIQHGQRCWLKTETELSIRGGRPSVRLVPDGGLTNIAVGPEIPPGDPYTEVPLVVELTPDAAASKVLQARLEPRFSGPANGNYVSNQTPHAGEKVQVESIVTMELRRGEVP
jgi:hypothetical protein